MRERYVRKTLLAVALLTGASGQILASVKEAAEVNGVKYYYCAPGKSTLIPRIADTLYDAARKRLIGSGWQPTTIYPTTAASEVTNFPETIFCSGTGIARCEFLWTDVFNNTLLISTFGEERRKINSFKFVCTK